MSARADERRSFVETTDWRGGEITTLSADASFRSYYRVAGGHGPAVLMDAPPGKEDVRPFMAVTGYLRSLDLSAPEIYAADIDRGFLLLEYLGDERVSQRLNTAPGQERSLYERAIDILLHTHETAPPASLPYDDAQYTLPPYDEDLLLKETALLPDWFITQGIGTPLDRDARAQYDDLWKPLLADVAGDRGCVVLRDYHVDNLMCLDDRPGLRRLGLLDYQDAVLGHKAYDLVSLLEDARRDVPKDLARGMLERYLQAAGISDTAAFRRAYDVLGAQRNAKIIGIFARLSRRDGKHAYLKLIPHVWRLLEEDLDRLGSPGLTAWLNDHAPADWRRQVLPARVKE